MVVKHKDILLTMIMIYTSQKCYETCLKGRDNIVKSGPQMRFINNCDTRFDMTTLSFNVKDYIQTNI